MRLIHTADIHLDSKLNANLDKDKAKERKRELLSTFIKMVDYAEANNISAILISGDLFDTRNISALARNTIKDLVSKHPDIKFFYLRGNHDENTILNAFEETPENLFLFTDRWTSYELSENGKVVLHGVELTGDNSASVQLQLAPDPAKLNIVMLHGQEAEATGNDKTEVINLKLFRNKGIDYMALGHVHAYKNVSLDGRGKYVYCGCLEPRGFDELGVHGFVVLDVDEESMTIKDTFIPFCQRRIYEVLADVTGLNTTAQMIGTVRECLKASNARKEDLVKVILVGDVDVECEKDTDFIRYTFEDEFYFLKVYDKTSLKVDPKDFVLDATLKGEFVRNVLASKALSDDEKGEIVRLGLEVLMGGNVEL